MDPNTALSLIRREAAVMLKADTSEAELADVGPELAAHIDDLDKWLTRGGHLPESWRRVPTLREMHENLRAVREPLGGPVPGVNDSHLPEGML